MSDRAEETKSASEGEGMSPATQTMLDVMERIGPVARRLMMAQPLNPFRQIKIVIPERGKLFNV